MNKIFLTLLLVLSLTANAEEVITAKTSKKNPTIKVSTVSLNPKLQSGILKNIKNSGWFSLSNSPTASYKLTLSNAGPGKIAVSIKDTSGNVIPNGQYTHDVSTIKGNWLQHRVVDEILGRVYNKQAKICSSRIAFSGSRRGIKEIYSIDFDGTNLKQETNYRSITVEPAWSPDNRYLSYTVYGRQNANLIQKDLHTKKHRILSSFRGLNSGAAFHPSGDKIMLTLSKGNNVDLYMLPLGNPKACYPITKNSNIESSPVWSPDGKRVSYVSASMRSNGKISSPKLYMLDMTQKRAWPLFKDGTERVSPDWSKTNILAYSKKMGREYVIAICDPNNPSTEKIIASGGGNWEAPTWAPDGRHLVCSFTSGSKTILYIIDTVLGFKKAIKLLQNGTPYFDKMTLPAWSNLY
jgi:TolB protein